MELNIYNKEGQLKATVSPDDSSTLTESLMSDYILSLSFTLFERVQLDVNDYVDFGGKRYWMLEAYIPNQKSTIEWNYNTKFYGIESVIRRALCLKTVDNELNPIFSLTAPAIEHVRLVVGNINRVMGTTDWKVGEVESTENLTIDYNGTYCDAALSSIATAADTEYWIDGLTVNVCRCEYGELIELGYDTGLKEITLDTNENAKFFTRLFPLGSTRNIDVAKYGSSRLSLPDGMKYVEQNTHYGIIEHSEESAFSAIYPRRVGHVDTVRHETKKGEDGKDFEIYYFTDPNIDFDPNQYEIGGLVKNIVFESGDLAGRDFEVNYNAEKKEFEVITQWPYNDDMQLPGALVMKSGDTYILYNITMPTEYYSLAEQEFATAVTAYMEKNKRDKSVYKAPTDYIDLNKREIVLSVGQRIHLVSDKYFPETGYRDSRITKITRKVNEPLSADIDISDLANPGGKAVMDQGISEAKHYAHAALSALPELIKSWENTPASDSNLYTSKRVDKEIGNKAMSKVKPDQTNHLLKLYGGAEVRNGLTADSAAIPRITERTTFEKGATTLNLLVQELATTYDLDVTHVATMLRGIIKDYLSSETFIPGFAGEGMKIYKALNGDWNMEIDNLTVRKVMNIFELVISKIRSVNGGLVISPANGTINSVSETTGSPIYYVLGIEGDMPFVVDDLLRCQVFSASGIKYYWVPVASVSGNSILVLKSEFGSAVPAVGDDLVQMGNRTNTARQSLIYLSAAEDGKPKISVLDGVNSTTFTGKNKVIMGCLNDITDSDFPADFQPSGYGLWAVNVFLKGIFVLRNGKTVDEEIESAQSAAAAAQDKAETVTRLFQEFTVADGVFESKITEAKTYTDAQVKDVQVGGRNWLVGSQCVVDGAIANVTTNGAQLSVDTVNTYLNQPTMRVDGALGFHWNSNPILEPGIEYTVSMMVKGSRNSVGRADYPLHLQIPLNAHHYEEFLGGDYNISTEWKTITTTFKNTASTPQHLRVYIFDIGDNIVNVAWCKVERGNKATDWSPAPEDVQADAQARADAAQRSAIKTTTTQIQQTAEEINLSVTQKIKNVQIGGRNLALQSNIGWSTPYYNVIQGTLSQDWVIGEQYTATIKGTINEGQLFGLWRDEGWVGPFHFEAIGGGLFQATFICPETPYFLKNRFSIYNYPSQTATSAEIEEIKIERGNKATDWSPAPEDLEARVSKTELNLQPNRIWAGISGNVTSLIPITNTSVDARNLDPNKYYLVTVGMDTTVPYTITVERPLGRELGAPEWSSHPYHGFSVLCKWTSNANGWGSIAVRRVIHAFTYAWSHVVPVGTIGQILEANLEYIYVRGGSLYNVKVEGTSSASVTLHTSNLPTPHYVAGSPIDSVTTPVVDLETKITTEDVKTGIEITGSGVSIFGTTVVNGDLIAGLIEATRIKTGKLEVTNDAKIGGFTIKNNRLESENKLPNGDPILSLDGTTGIVNAYKGVFSGSIWYNYAGVQNGETLDPLRPNVTLIQSFSYSDIVYLPDITNNIIGCSFNVYWNGIGTYSSYSTQVLKSRSRNILDMDDIGAYGIPNYKMAVTCEHFRYGFIQIICADMYTWVIIQKVGKSLILS